MDINSYRSVRIQHGFVYYIQTGYVIGNLNQQFDDPKWDTRIK